MTVGTQTELGFDDSLSTPSKRERLSYFLNLYHHIVWNTNPSLCISMGVKKQAVRPPVAMTVFRSQFLYLGHSLDGLTNTVVYRHLLADYDCSRLYLPCTSQCWRGFARYSSELRNSSFHYHRQTEDCQEVRPSLLHPIFDGLVSLWPLQPLPCGEP